MRVTVQLADAASGRIVWAERFTLRAEEEQLRQHDDIVDRVAARLGDLYGVLATAVLSRARRKPSEQITLCEAVLANLRYQLHLADGMYANALQNAEQAITADPEFAWGWAALALLYMDNFLLDIDPRAGEAAENALYCIRQALKADAECGLAHFSQGIYHLTRGEVEQCIAAAERTVEYAHGAPFETAGGGGLLAMVGEQAKSQPLVDWAIHNNPGLPGWIHWASTVNHIRRGDQQQALLATQRYSLPECFWDHLFRATAQFVAGDNDQAKSSLARAHHLRPSLIERRREMVHRLVPQPELQNVLINEVPRL
jgi:tetratricopeptide (TPR) repeat protein